MDTRTTERIGELECSVWRGEGLKHLYDQTFGWRFLIVLAVLFAGVAIWVWAMFQAIGAGQDTLAKLLAVAPMVAVYAGVLLVGRFGAGKLTEYDVSELPRPSSVPRGALPVLVRIKGESTRGLSQGWFWCDGPWVMFEGERFDFRLAARDFVTQKKSLLVGVERPMIVPRGLPATSIFIRIGWIEGMRIHPVKHETAQLASATEAWAVAASEPREPSLYPPLRYPPEPASPLPWVRLFAIGAIVGIGVAVLLVAAPTAPRDRVLPISLISAIFVPGLFAMLRGITRGERLANARAIERYEVRR